MEQQTNLWMLGGALALACAACSPIESESEPGVEPDPFPPGGQVSVEEAAYPPGPYGLGVGSTIANQAWWGFANAMQANGDPLEIKLGDFYNPTGKGTFPEGSPFGEGVPKPVALLIYAEATWGYGCFPGIYQPSIQAELPCAMLLRDIVQGSTPGKPATITTARNLAIKFGVTGPVVADPSAKIMPYVPQDAFPMNVLIDTRTMTIVETVAGTIDDGSEFWDGAFADILANGCGP